MKRLLITSPEGYARRLVRAFGETWNADGLAAMSRPMIRTDIFTGSAEFESFIARLETMDYIAFASRKAIEALSVYVEEHGIVLPERVKLCAIGKDNEALTELLHAEPAFVAEEPSPKGIVDELARTEGTEGKRIAVLAPQVVGMDEPHIVPDFIDGLQGIGMKVERITAYRTRAASEEVLAETCEMIAAHRTDAIIFTSGTEIKVLLGIVPQDTDAGTFLKDVDIICYGPYTASCAERLGLKVDFTSPRFGSFDELAEEVGKHYSRKKD